MDSLSHLTGQALLRRLKRIMGFSPTLEWRCGTSWSTDLFKAMGADSGSAIARYQKGNAVWERECELELHEFKYRCLNHLSEVSDGEHELTNFPPSFGQALEVKRKWIDGQASDHEVQKAIQSVTSGTGELWPSNWCFGINAMFAAKSLVLAALDHQRSTASAAKCAEHLIFYMSFSTACIKMKCHESNEMAPSEDMGEITDDGVVVRGVACPHMEDDEIERVANSAIDKAALSWRNKLTEELVGLITPK